MSIGLRFSISHTYGNPNDGVSVPITLSAGKDPVEIIAKIDTGATFCIFQRLYGELLGLDIESGIEERIGQVTGSFLVYGHTVGISTLGVEFESMVYFAKNDEMNRNVLGRRGWLDLLRIGIIHYDSRLYLSDYSEDSD